MDYKLLFDTSVEALDTFKAQEQGEQQYLSDFLVSRWKVSKLDG